MNKLLGLGLLSAASAAFALGRYWRSSKGVVSDEKFPLDKPIKTNE